MEGYTVRKSDSPANIDELLLNVLGGEFFRIRQIPVRFVPVLPKKLDREQSIYHGLRNNTYSK
jgi:hypothetical protein